MDKKEVNRFNKLYKRHLQSLKLQGKSKKTIDCYARAVRRLRDTFNCCPDKLKPEQLEDYFADLVESHSWSTVKIDRYGLQFFWRYVLKTEWKWIDIVKPPRVKTIPDILTPKEIERIISKTRKLRYRVYLLTVYSMGLRLSEAISLQTSDIDGERKQVHIRNGKGHKDRLVPLPDFTYQALRTLWKKHRNPTFIFPNAKSPNELHSAITHMNVESVQQAMKKVVTECNIKKKYQYTHLGIHLQPICLREA